MKKLLILLVLVFSVFSTAFAYHTPNQKELNDIHRIFGGFYLDDKEKEPANWLMFDNDGSITFMHKGVYHEIKEPNLQVDFNDGYRISFNGNCSKPDCGFQGWNVYLSFMQTQRKRSGFAYSLNLSRFKTLEEIKRENITDIEKSIVEESYIIRKI